MHNQLHLTPKFSVITVCFNAQDTIEDTIQSVITQTYHHVEYIIIDGASKDGTLDIINRYRDHITRVVSEPDRGLYDAMNKGMALATGDYLCFLNAGDSFHEDDTLQQMVHELNAGCTSAAESQQELSRDIVPTTDSALPDVLYGQTQLVDREGHFLRMRRLQPPARLTWKSFRSGMLVCHQAFFAKRSLAGTYDLKYRYSADFDWCIRIMKKAKQMQYIHLTLIDYLSEGMTTQNHRASLKERFRIMAHHYGWLSTVFYHAWFVLRALVKK